MPRKLNYDVALSFAGEDRGYVSQVAETLDQIGVKVFYDEYEKVDLWGKNLSDHLDNVYRRQAKYCVIFVSKFYKRKLWTNHERESAQARALTSRKEYILPARFDDTELPGLRATSAFIDLRTTTPDELAVLLAKKLGRWSDVDEMLSCLRSWLPNYVITVEGTKVHFACETEDYSGSFSLKLMVEMHRQDELERMFLMPSIVPF